MNTYLGKKKGKKRKTQQTTQIFRKPKSITSYKTQKTKKHFNNLIASHSFTILSLIIFSPYILGLSLHNFIVSLSIILLFLLNSWSKFIFHYWWFGYFRHVTYFSTMSQVLMCIEVLQPVLHKRRYSDTFYLIWYSLKGENSMGHLQL